MEEQKKKKKYNKNNFFNQTYCVFKGAELYKIRKRKPNYRSESGSTYYYTTKGVYRLANHWGRAARCKWRLDSNLPAEIDDLRLGFAEWTDFKEYVSDTSDSYYIHVDFEKKKVDYMHKEDEAYDGVAVIRTAEATRKIIKQIKNLLEDYKWAKYYDYDIEELREIVITDLINTTKTLQDIKQELKNEMYA